MNKEDLIIERAQNIGYYIVTNNATIRQAAKAFGVGRSTVFRDIHFRLPNIDYELAERALKIIENNKNERHIRGGNATKSKFLKYNK